MTIEEFLGLKVGSKVVMLREVEIEHSSEYRSIVFPKGLEVMVLSTDLYNKSVKLDIPGYNDSVYVPLSELGIVKKYGTFREINVEDIRDTPRDVYLAVNIDTLTARDLMTMRSKDGIFLEKECREE